MNNSKRISKMLLVVLLVVYTVPLFMIIMLSFTDKSGSGLQFSLSSYSALFSNSGIILRLKNSLFISLCTVMICFPYSFIQALLMLKAGILIRRGLLFLFVIMLFMPFQSYMLPIFKLSKAVRLYNSHWSLILYGAFSPMGPLIVYVFMKAIPDDQWEAASLETTSLLKILWTVIIPQLGPATAVLALLTFVEGWNIVEPAVILIKYDELMPLSVSLNDFKDTSWAAAAMYCFPVIAAYIICCCLLKPWSIKKQQYGTCSRPADVVK